ncbi:hypothetical protein [Paraburkholderia atlantica]|uniref:hypothetical protein n=1 Tax=Paraburkholderia atlantica TaxID=2654982 RepID=UPI00161F1B8B|nr:hypothetical protein [Paraburkholderia atlantica]MBB5508148.1 hypothetical protein [Paraburkholderia atlantica]
MSYLQRKLFSRVFRNEAGEAGDTGGGGAPDVQKMIADAVASAVTGLKAKNDELLGKLKHSNEQLKAFDGIDPVKTKEMIARFENDAEAKLIAEGKLSEVIEKRTERLRADYEKKLSDAHALAQNESERAKAFQGRVLDDAIRAAAAQAGLHQYAIDDALLRGRSMFSLNADGQAVQLGPDGQPVLGKDGKSAFSPAEWLEGMKESAPHWFPAAASGGGSTGGSGGSSSKKTMTRAAFDQLPPLKQAETARSGVTITD